MTSLCIYPPQTGRGGPASFTSRLISALGERGIHVHHDPLAPDCAAVLVIGGTRRMDLVWRARKRGVRVVQRLNGMNWLHRRLPTGLKHFLRAEANNWILAVIRSRLADRIIYQSQFSRDWWQAAHGAVRAPGTVIYNGVDLDAFSPEGPDQRPSDAFRLLLVEGHLGGTMVSGLKNAAELVSALSKNSSKRWELMVAGEVPQATREQIAAGYPGPKITFAGAVPRDQVPDLDRSAHVLFSADLNAACPNSVIEALACGLPVAAYATGALAEMVPPGAGCVAPYGSNHWKLEPPVVGPLAEGVRRICLEQDAYRAAARARAVEHFDIRKKVSEYLEILL